MLTKAEQRAEEHARDLFLGYDDPVTGPYFSARGGINPGQPYPGMAPVIDDDISDWSAVDWHHRLGQGCAINEPFPNRDHLGNLLGPEGFGMPEVSLLSSDSGYTEGIFGGDLVEKADKDVDMERFDRVRAGSGGRRGFNRSDGFYYDQSYWLDIGSAYLHTLAACQYVWAQRIDGIYTGGGPTDPPRGVPSWYWRDDPNTRCPKPPDGGGFKPVLDGGPIPANYFAQPAGASGRPASMDASEFMPDAACRDRDIDGDGEPDVPCTFDTMAEVDAQFLRNLGEWPEYYATGSRPIKANVGLEMGKTNQHSLSNYNQENSVPMLRYRPLPLHENIKGMLNRPGGPDDPNTDEIEGPITADQAALMELVVNDFRTSFFGASPAYPEFRPLDLDDDGVVRCSVYRRGYATADPLTGCGPNIDPDTKKPFCRFSLTGYFTFQKSRHYRIFYRGEVYDTMREVVVGQTNGEAVYVVDPDGDVWDVHMRAFDPGAKPPGTGTGMTDSHLIMNRHHANRYRGSLSNASR